MAPTSRPRTYAAAALAALSLGCIGGRPGASEPAEGAGRSDAPSAEGAAEAAPGAGAEGAEGAADTPDADGAAEGAAAGGAETGDGESDGFDPDRPNDTALREEADNVLDDWHLAASEVDQDRYLGHLAPDVVFMGTDRTERWDLAAFRGYVEEHFGQGRGWTYVPSDRYVHLGPSGDVAWFDERLTSNSYGDLRGTGALRWDGETWRIVHYSMTFTVPNDIAREVVGVIRDGAR